MSFSEKVAPIAILNGKQYFNWRHVAAGGGFREIGADGLLAEGVVGSLGPFGPYAVLFGFFMITFLATSIILTAALVVLMVPITLKTSPSLEISSHILRRGFFLPIAYI